MFLRNRSAACIAALLMMVSAGAQETVPVEFNRDELVMISIKGSIAMPGIADEVYRITADGTLQVMPGTGGIT